MTFKLQNKYLAGFISWVGVLGDLTAKQARMRGRFITILVARLNEVNDLHKALLIKYGTKDTDGQPIIKKNDAGIDSYDISAENMPTFMKDDQELLDENFVLDVTEANKDMFECVKDLVLNTAFTFGPKETDTLQEKQQKIEQSNDYDIWCKGFEAAQ